MAKEALKKKAETRQNGKCALTGKKLPKKYYLYDTDRKTPKAEGGIYTDDNTRAVDPVAHMERHGNLRLRDAELDELKALVDDREQIMKLRNKIANQLRAAKRRTDILLSETIEFLEEELKKVEPVLRDRTRRVDRWVKNHKTEDALIEAAMGVFAVGENTVAYCTAYIDLNKANHPSSLWAYTGLDKPSHARYTKGQPSGGNGSLRCALWNMAKTQVRLNGPYHIVYDNTKKRLAASKKLTKSRNTQGKLVEVMWCDTKPCHRDGAAIRAIMKHFLADYWMVGRTLLGLPTEPLYVEAVLGHSTIVRPEQRGWGIATGD